MSDAKHTPAGDPSFRASLLRNLGSAVGLIVAVALVFWAIGSFGGEDGDPEPTVAADDGAADREDGADPDATDDGATDGADPAAEDDEPDPDADEPDDEADADAEADVDDDADADEVDPADVSIQVLDGLKEDGGAAADDVAALLGDRGYSIAARNEALSYDQTTVLYNPGNEAAAQQVADELGGAEVLEQPGNLSTSVDLHVVVGADRA